MTHPVLRRGFGPDGSRILRFFRWTEPDREGFSHQPKETELKTLCREITPAAVVKFGTTGRKYNKVSGVFLFGIFQLWRKFSDPLLK